MQRSVEAGDSVAVSDFPLLSPPSLVLSPDFSFMTHRLIPHLEEEVPSGDESDLQESSLLSSLVSHLFLLSFSPSALPSCQKKLTSTFPQAS